MANRKFRDRDGQQWEVRDLSHSEWVLEPILDNPGTAHRIKPPNYESDPFELTDQELLRLLEQSSAEPAFRPPPRKSPFLDD
jgi:hypothetical protein